MLHPWWEANMETNIMCWVQHDYQTQTDPDQTISCTLEEAKDSESVAQELHFLCLGANIYICDKQASV